MSQSEGKLDGLAVRLRDVRAVRINALAWDEDDEPPEWAKDPGAINLGAFGENSVIVELTAAFSRKLMGIKISLQGLYEVSEESAAVVAKTDDEQTILDRIPDEYRAQLAALASTDLFPFMRQVVVTTSAQINPHARVVLTPPGGWELLTPWIEDDES